ncbi:hypothetical protein BDV96DRAFT_491189 [Lophiotrema nucula]|uniref:N-acetyltransferase domain-containing protein n=1 Tax=Lophiotrema nucula TaxID=690887 RepID=A0A6A5ZB87_9PLEO|nr:hypothetical protein BDV96DRAFT_491189 [Lophiotrema nucula]
MDREASLPSFDSVRLATPDDLARMATVAAAGFFWSPTFQLQRPRYAEFPEDTLSSYWRAYLSDFKDPTAIVLVAEDARKDDEAHSVYDALRNSTMYETGTDPKSKTIVGVCSVNLKPDSWRVGLFQDGSKHAPHVDPPGPHAADNSNRDFDQDAYALYNELTSPAKKKFLADHMKLSTLAVHPAYWRRGHAASLVGWCTRLADMDGVSIGVSAAPMGAKVASQAGFEEQATIRIKRTLTMQHNLSRHGGPDVGDVELWIGIRPPSDISPERSDSPATSSL